MICAEVLDIKYVNKSKEVRTWHQIDTSICYKWTVKESQLKSIKNGTSKRAMVSDRFGTDYNWRCVFYPDDLYGNSKLVLQLLVLPNKVSAVETRISFSFNNSKKKKSVHEQVFGY